MRTTSEEKRRALRSVIRLAAAAGDWPAVYALLDTLAIETDRDEDTIALADLFEIGAILDDLLLAKLGRYLGNEGP